MTSTIKMRSKASAVSRILSIASIPVLTAVEKPMVKSVPSISLSMVPGIPIIVPGQCLFNASKPLKEPSPPITIKASIFSFLRVAAADSKLYSVSMAGQRALFKIVPPRWIMPLTLAGVSNVELASIKPL
jgi:hypothetical protein